jgi:hypothetical protein
VHGTEVAELKTMNLTQRIFSSALATLILGTVACSQNVEDASEADLTRIERASFVCETRAPLAAGKKHKIAFALGGLSRRNGARWVFPNDAERESAAPIVATPATSRLGVLNEEASVENNAAIIAIRSNISGLRRTEVQLYGDVQFKRGHVRITDLGEGAGDTFAWLDCSVRTLETVEVPSPDAPSAAPPISLTPSSLPSALKNAQTSLQASADADGNCSVALRSYTASADVADAKTAVQLVQQRLTYKKYREARGPLSAADQRKKVLEWVPSASSAQLDELFRAIDGIATQGAPQNGNLWLSSDNLPSATQEWAEHVMVYHYPGARTIVTVAMKCTM